MEISPLPDPRQGGRGRTSRTHLNGRSTSKRPSRSSRCASRRAPLRAATWQVHCAFCPARANCGR
eukprot:4627820-Alexandrium_andersonii.AAC.1